jgi:hypothetical protein
VVARIEVLLHSCVKVTLELHLKIDHTSLPLDEPQHMNLDEAQRKKVTDWIKDGLKLSEIQNRLASELNVRLTYMDVRLLVDDLKLTPKDAEPAKPLSPPASAAAPASPLQSTPAQPAAEPAPGTGVSVSVDQIARPGTVVSGKVTFTDGNQGNWYFDQGGRLGFIPQQQGYRPPPADLQQFQAALDAELSKMGL